MRARQFDDARIGQELAQIAPHRPEIGAVGRAEIDQQHADPRLGHDGVTGGQRTDGLGLIPGSRCEPLLFFPTMTFPKEPSIASLRSRPRRAGKLCAAGGNSMLRLAAAAKAKEPARQVRDGLCHSARERSVRCRWRDRQRLADLQRARPVARVGVGDRPPFGRVLVEGLGEVPEIVAGDDDVRVRRAASAGLASVAAAGLDGCRGRIGLGRVRGDLAGCRRQFRQLGARRQVRLQRLVGLRTAAPISVMRPSSFGV